MTLPTGSLSMSQIGTELGLSLPLSLQHAWVRALAQVGGAACDFNSLRGKTGRFDGSLASFITGSGGSTRVNVSFSSAPFFGGTLNLMQANPFTFVVTLFTAGAPNWTGNIKVTNNSSGDSQVLAYAGGSPPTWTVTDGSGNLVRNPATDSFTILPSS